MWKSFFMAVGISVALVGVQFLGVEKIVLKYREEPPPKKSPYDEAPTTGPLMEIKSQPWTPYSLLGTGVIISIYSVTLSKRLNG